MMCPAAVANEMSGLKGRAKRMEHPKGRMDALISGPSFGAGNEDQGSRHTGYEWIDQLDPGGGNSGDVGPTTAALAEAVGQARLRWAVGSSDATAESKTGAPGGCGKGADALSRSIFRSECEAFRREATRTTPDPIELHVGQNGAPDGRASGAAAKAGTTPQEASASSAAGDAATCGWQPASLDSWTGQLSGPDRGLR